ncbi:MAG: hypothetical protein AVO33_11020 [delta proteobacterium ML8_F1]|nr:MAG: hypothetical protein AVO33_11020 [delta proteobacterium ML8_F1]
MAEIMRMPKLGLTMVEGKIGKWYKSEGDRVTLEDELLQVETDKITNTVHPASEGILLKIIRTEGDKVPVKEPICIIGEAGDDIEALLEGSAMTVDSALEKPAAKPAGTIPAEASSGTPANREILASPIAKRLAREKGIDLGGVTGTGPKGRIVEKDILEYRSGPKMSPTARVLAAQRGVDPGSLNKATRVMKDDVLRAAREQDRLGGFVPEEEVSTMSGMRQIIAERMHQSWLTSPMVNYDLKVETTMLKQFKDQMAPKLKVTYTDLLAAILSKVVLEFPLLNSTIEGENLLTRNFVNLGVAVALDEGLIVPVVKYANTMSLMELSGEIKYLVESSKNNSLDADRLQGGTITLTNLGMYQVESFTPVINQPEVAILGVTAIKDTVVVKNNEIVIAPMMNLCLTADHRAVDGAVAAQFMARMKEVIENPGQLLLF